MYIFQVWNSDWLALTNHTMEEWRSELMTSGVLCVTDTGIIETQQSCVDRLAMTLVMYGTPVIYHEAKVTLSKLVVIIGNLN